MAACCASLLALFVVLDGLRSARAGAVQPRHLQQAIVAHLELFRAAYPGEEFTPKTPFLLALTRAAGRTPRLVFMLDARAQTQGAETVCGLVHEHPVLREVIVL
eukprot:4752298-Alexandrium_andersonii.AAC.1